MRGITEADYWRALASEIGLDYTPNAKGLRLDPAMPPPPMSAVARALAVFAIRTDGRRVTLVAPDASQIPPLLRLVRDDPAAAADNVSVAEPATIRAVLLSNTEKARAHVAVRRLRRWAPDFSARAVPARWMREALVSIVLVGFFLALFQPWSLWVVADLLLALYLAHSNAWKFAIAIKPRSRVAEPVAVSDAALPTYSVLVPLYRESAVIPDLVRAMSRLSYPRAKLQVLLVIEEDDHLTAAAVRALARDPAFQVVSVPVCEPRTKPKALVYAMSFVRGELLCVFDAEDRPDRDQLRRAAAAFASDERLAVVQARLVPENRECWLARMFALEFAAHFGVLLPGLAEWRMALPLGGTSNHFRRQALEDVGAWDPFNVAEDADLGLRFARFGYRTGIIRSRTLGEAAIRLRDWFPQSRRWIKGWMQTAIVALSTRSGPCLEMPDRLLVHGLVAGGVVTSLAYPLALLLPIGLLFAPDGLALRLVLGVNLANLLILVVMTLVATVRGLCSVKAGHLAIWLPTIPIYWMLISIAAWQALWQLAREPHRWEKTTHGVSRARSDESLEWQGNADRRH